MNIMIREIRETEIPMLKDFLYEAVFIPPGAEAPPRAVVDTPELQVYVRDFGRQAADLGLVAEVDGKVIGAVWGQVSLSVQKLNGAVRLYRRLGFKVADENSEEYIMVKELGRQ